MSTSVSASVLPNRGSLIYLEYGCLLPYAVPIPTAKFSWALLAASAPPPPHACSAGFKKVKSCVSWLPCKLYNPSVDVFPCYPSRPSLNDQQQQLNHALLPRLVVGSIKLPVLGCRLKSRTRPSRVRTFVLWCRYRYHAAPRCSRGGLFDPTS